MNTAVAKGRAKGLSDEFVIQLLTAIHQESIRHQTIVMNKESICKYGIHTINVVDDMIVVDGQKWTFSPLNQLKSFARESSKFP